MTDKQKQAILLLNKLFWVGRENMSEEDKENYFLLLEFIIGEKDDPVSITTSKFFDWEDNKLKDIPQTVMYGCGIPGSTTTYSTETDNANKV